ncbi:PKD domain-containing protein [Pedobacter sp. SD-b]|uniref:PKD domain-containing protein n=1 Tax=Pedobacter segetis TaxID=2793069 RepID=A0ABS1BFV9_9SPHI|nr:PKD domain-containing protein [Pedobacter segetis]MBK0381757.1 PKD domain-containing protein [Pedobacter segetis]
MLKPLKPLFTLILGLFCLDGFTQNLSTDTVAAKISYQQNENNVKFSSELRQLRQIAGAPEPFYSYFWEFGDGGFSFEKEPLHIYADSGVFYPRLYATNNYDDGKPPPKRPVPVKISALANSIEPVNTNFFKPTENLALKSNTMPKPDEEMVLILGYKKNILASNLPQSGKIILFYNDKEFKQDNFKLDDIRLYHNEQKSEIKDLLKTASNYHLTQTYYAKNGPLSEPDYEVAKNNNPSLKEKMDKYRNAEAWTYKNLGDHERFMFLSLKTTPEMLQDTNAMVTLSAMIIPDDPLLDVSVSDLELQIVASHDPNKMMLKNRSMNYRFVGKKHDLVYRVRFQNTGKGPAKKVDVGVKIPENLDKSSIKVLKTNPSISLKDSNQISGSYLDTLSKKDSIHFIFKNIYLAGTKQDNVNDQDSTKGFVEYSINFKKKPKKIPFDSGAAIVFDKNEPIYTNRSEGKFKPGISPGLILNYGNNLGNLNTNELGKQNYALGFSISPFSPYRKYLQAELFISYYNGSKQFLSSTATKKDTTINNRGNYVITNRRSFNQNNRLNLEVPLQLRYNLNNYVGIGGGGMFSFTLNQKDRLLEQLNLQQNLNGIISQLAIDKQGNALKKNFSDFNTSIFFDVQFGMVRKGPAIGFRYIQSLSIKDQRLSTYLSWKI